MESRRLNRRPPPALVPLPRLLVVDGDPDARALYRAMFQTGEYAIEACDDGAEALGKAISTCPDLIIMGTRIRRIDGFALCQLLRADVETRFVPIVAVVAAAAPAERMRAARAGADVVLAKPFGVEQVIEAVRQMLDRPPHSGFVTGGTTQAAADRQPAAEVSAAANEKRRCKSRTFQRQQTTIPPFPPPALRCPSCDTVLAYRHSHVGGVSETALEQWDYFVCDRCGSFQYRHRTRVLKLAV